MTSRHAVLTKHYKPVLLRATSGCASFLFRLTGGGFVAGFLDDNHQRFIKHDLDITAKAVRLVPLSTYHSESKVEDYGSSTAHIFNFELY